MGEVLDASQFGTRRAGALPRHIQPTHEETAGRLCDTDGVIRIPPYMVRSEREISGNKRPCVLT
jgi:hypothetical protein